MGAVERLDMLLNDAMYGILFRDINMQRTFVDQYFSRRIIARSGIVINTGEDNYLTTADAVEQAPAVLASQFINERLAKNAGLEDWQIGLGHAFARPEGDATRRPRAKARAVFRVECARAVPATPMRVERDILASVTNATVAAETTDSEL
jgi:hypothetical protein